jgi:hypothetical protein
VAGGLLVSSVQCDARSLVKCPLRGTSAGCGQNVVELVTAAYPAPETARTALYLNLNRTLPLKVTAQTLLLLLRLWWPWHL